MTAAEKVRLHAHLPADTDLIMAVTGHRPPKLGGYNAQTTGRCVALATKMLGWYRPDYILTGMALGWDQAIAEACVKIGVPWTACVPFPGQESKWPTPAQWHYNSLLAKATEVTYVCTKYNVGAMQARNAFMVNRGQILIALWNGVQSGGTWHAVDFARTRKVYTINLWSSYCNRVGVS